MIISILTLISSWITSLSTSITAYKRSQKNVTKVNNCTQKLYVVLQCCMKKYKTQLHVLKDIFRVENDNEKLYKINSVNDLEMIAYIEGIIRTCQSSIDEFTAKAEHILNSDEIETLMEFSSCLKNFFMLTNEIKDMATKDGKKESHITVHSYKEHLMMSIPYSIRDECGGVNVDFPHLLENFDNKIENMWSDIECSLIDSKRSVH